jgi:HAD superfamily hydrolase (TIGR01549 family)
MRLYIRGSSFKAIVFDLDGTLYPRETYISAYYDFTLHALGELLHYGRKDAEEALRKENISGDPKAKQGSVSSLMVRLGVPIDFWNKYRDEKFALSRLVSYDPELEEGVRRLGSSYHLAIVTNNTLITTKNILAKLGLADADFSLIITSDSELSVKPISKCFIHVAERLTISPHAMLSIGDRFKVDIEPLLALGGSGILVSGPKEIPLIVEKLCSLTCRGALSDNNLD